MEEEVEGGYYLCVWCPIWVSWRVHIVSCIQKSKYSNRKNIFHHCTSTPHFINYQNSTYKSLYSQQYPTT